MSHSPPLPCSSPYSPCSPFDFTLTEDCELNETIPDIKINPSEIIQFVSLFNTTPFSEIFPLAVVEEIKKHNKWTFNPMKDKKLSQIQEVLNGQDDSEKPLSLLDLADHLVTMDEYDFALFTYMEAVSLSAKIYETNSNPDIVWLVHDGLLAIAKIIRNGSLMDYLEDYESVSRQIFNYLKGVFNSEEAMSYLPLMRSDLKSELDDNQ